MKKVYSLLLIACLLLLPTNAFAASEESSETNNTSTLPRMTDTCLKDIIDSEAQVVINDETAPGNSLSSDVSGSVEDEEAIKNLIEEYGKDFFLGVIGHEVSINPSVTNDQALLDELNARSKYLVQAYVGELFSSYDYDLIYNQLEIKDDKAKVVVTRNITLQTNFERKNQVVDSLLTQNEGYTLEKIDGEWKLVNVIFNTMGIPNDAIDSLSENENPDEWVNNYSFENLKRDQYEDTKTFSDMVSSDGEIHLEDFVEPTIESSKAYDKLEQNPDDPTVISSYNYSKAKADEYAEMFGSNPNPNYRFFYLGGDCTNFVSQAMYHAGMPQSNYWYYNDGNDYSSSWTVVDDLRDYIMEYTLSEGYYQNLPDYPYGVNYAGTVIQFSNGSTWSHSAIVREYYDGSLFIAEHSGTNGNQSYILKPTDFSNVRTFWIAKG